MHYFIKSGIWDFKKRGTPGELDLSRIINSTPSRTQNITSSTTVTPNSSSEDFVIISNQSSALALAAPTGSPSEGQGLVIRIYSDGAYAITYDSIYRVIGVTLPTTTIAGKTQYIACIYNAIDVKWDVIGVRERA